jgi:class 3 adenylate cyclase
VAWINGDHSEPAFVRDRALEGPQVMSMRGAVAMLPYAVFVNGPLAAHLASYGVTGFVALELIVGMAYLVAGFIIGSGFRLLLRPLFSELEPYLLDEPPQVHTWTIRTRLVTGVAASCLMTGVFAAGMSHWTDSKEAALMLGLATAAVVGLYATSLNLIGLIGPTLAPVRDLTRAAERVARGDLTQRVAITSTDEFGELSLAFNEMMAGLRQREALHAAFGSYVDPALTQRLLNQDSSIFEGEAVEATVFFADVRGFTHYAESVEPEEAVAQLNRLFEILVPAIRDNGGHPNRYTGDGVIAVFGTPEPLPDHANLACTAAVAIQQAVRERFGDSMHLGIGINTGKVIAGTIGGGGKLDFTVIGDAVNIASRVEELTKATGDSILVTEQTLHAAWSVAEGAVARGAHVLRGRAGPTQVFALQT